MYKWLSLLSARQRSEMVAIMLIMAIILGVGVAMNLPNEKTTSEIFTTDMSIRDIAPKLEVTGKGLARELALPLETPKKNVRNVVHASRLVHYMPRKEELRAKLFQPIALAAHDA